MNKQARLAVALAMIGLALYMFQTNRQATTPANNPASAASAAPDQAVKPPPQSGPGPRDFLVAKQRLDPALISRLTTDLVEVRTIPEQIPVPDSSLVFKSFDQVQDKMLDAIVEQGEVLLRTRFKDARSDQMQKKLRDVIPNGWRAISLDVDAVTGTTGFINQGDIVDVAATYTSGGRQLTRIIIQNVEVLARGAEYRTQTSRTQDRTIRGEGGGGILFTLKVKPEMAVKLAHLVDERGFNRFRLILKNRDDKQELRSVGVLLREVLTDQPRSTLRSGQGEETPTEIEILRGFALARESSEDNTQGPPPAGAAPAEPGAQGQQQAQAPQGAGDLLSRIRTEPRGGPASEAPPTAPAQN